MIQRRLPTFFLTSLEDGLEDAVVMFVEDHGEDAAPDTLDAVQEELALSGAKFTRAKGKLTDSAVAALKALAED